MKNLIFAAFLGVVGVALVTGDCQHDFDTCKAAYSRALPMTKTSTTALCNVGNNFVSCLRNLQGCGSIQTSIDNERRKTEEMLQRNASQCMLCTTEAERCLATYNAASDKADTNVTAKCNDGQVFVLCLEHVDRRIECKGERTRIEVSRRKAEEKLNLGQCDTGHTCLPGVKTCQLTEQNASNALINPTMAQQCSLSQTFYDCMSGLQTKCSGIYLTDLKTAMTTLVTQGNSLGCTISTGSAGGLSASVVFTSLVMTVAALLK